MHSHSHTHSSAFHRRDENRPFLSGRQKQPIGRSANALMKLDAKKFYAKLQIDIIVIAE